MREVSIIGVGQTPVDEHWDRPFGTLEAIIKALHDADREEVDGLLVGNMMSGMTSRQENLGGVTC